MRSRSGLPHLKRVSNPDLRAVVESFVAAAVQPAMLDPGEEPLLLYIDPEDPKDEPLLPNPEPEVPDPPNGEDDPPMPVALAPFVAPVGVMPPVCPTVCPNKPTGGTLASP